MASRNERTFIAIKPDAVQRGLVAKIVKRFEQRGYKLVGLKMLVPNEALLREHYAEHVKKPFFAGLAKFMSSGPVVAMVWEGLDVVKTGRTMLGETKPLESKPGTIRGDFSVDLGRNIVHGSDSVESANREINLWFRPEELFNWMRATDAWIYE